MNDFIFFKGKLPCSDLLISHGKGETYTHFLEPSVIDAVWDKYLSHAKQTGRKIWDASLYSLTKLVFYENNLHLTIGTVGVKEVLAAREGLIQNNPPNNLFVSALIKTVDNLYLFGRRTITSLHNWEMIGGTLSQSEMKISCGNDILSALYNEFDEEINIQQDNVLHSKLIGVIGTKVQSIGLIWESKLAVTASEVVGRFESRNDGEIKELKFVSPAKLKDFLAKQDSYIPMIANLL